MPTEPQTPPEPSEDYSKEPTDHLQKTLAMLTEALRRGMGGPKSLARMTDAATNIQAELTRRGVLQTAPAAEVTHPEQATPAATVATAPAAPAPPAETPAPSPPDARTPASPPAKPTMTTPQGTTVIQSARGPQKASTVVPTAAPKPTRTRIIPAPSKVRAGTPVHATGRGVVVQPTRQAPKSAARPHHGSRIVGAAPARRSGGTRTIRSK